MRISQISFSVIKVTQPIGDFYIGNISAKDIVEISYSDVRRIEGEQRTVEKYLGIQRPLDEKRVKEIKKYLDSPDASFPTGVVLSVEQKCAEYDPQNGILLLKEFIPENYEITPTGEVVLKTEVSEDAKEDPILLQNVGKVLDGQHRIAAFTRPGGKFDPNLEELSKTFNFNVVVFVGLDIDEQANIFATVNLAQTKVNRSLVYDLEGLLKTRSPFKSCHKIAVALDSADDRSPLYKRIKRLGVKTKNREQSEPLTQAVFVESLVKLISPQPFEDRKMLMKGKSLKHASANEVMKYPFRNMFIDGRDTEIAVILHNYFKAIQNKWPKAWEERSKEGNILPRSNAFKAFMRYLKIAYLKIVRTEIGRIPTVEEFEDVFRNLNVQDSDFTTGNFKPGSGGESAFFKLLTGEKTIQDLKE